MWGLLVGFIVPHAPVLLPQLRGGEPVSSDIPKPDEDSPLCVVLSPHGDQTGVYRRVRGDLRDFGVEETLVQRKTDRVFGKELSRRWGEPLLEEDVDHGVLVPLVVGLPPTLTVVGATLKEVTGPAAGSIEDAIASAKSFASAVEEIAEQRDLIIAASAHTSAGLSLAAPLTELPAAKELEKEVTKALEEDLGRLTEIEPQLWVDAGACGVGPLTAFGMLFAGRTAKTTFREAPFGVGYLLAQTA